MDTPELWYGTVKDRRRVGGKAAAPYELFDRSPSISHLAQQAEAVCAFPLALHLNHENPCACAQDAACLCDSYLSIVTKMVFPNANSDATTSNALKAGLRQCHIEKHLPLRLSCNNNAAFLFVVSCAGSALS